MALALGLSLLAAQPPAPRPASAPPGAFSGERAMEGLARLLGDGAPHPVGTEANALVAQRIEQELAALGYTSETQEAWACSALAAHCAFVTNVMARLPGKTEGPAVLLTAHYDSVPAGPGAADDTAGVAAILEIARVLRGAPPLPNPVIFLFSDGEEPGLLGAEAFTEHPWAEDVGVVVNLEANGTRGQSVLFETTENNAWLINAYASQAPRPVAGSLYDLLYTYLPHKTDLTVYEAAGWPGINFAFSEGGALYHTPLDDLAHLDPGSVQHHGDNALAAVRALAQRDLAHPPAGDSVYMDVLPGLVLRWPEASTAGLAAACLAVWIIVTARLLRIGAASWRGLLLGSLVLPVSAVASAALGFGLTYGLARLTNTFAPWYATPWPTRVALWAGALLCLASCSLLAGRWASSWSMAMGVWLWWALLALLTALVEPAASAIFLVPAAVGLLALSVVTLTPLVGSARARMAAVLIGLFATSWFWLLSAMTAETFGLGPELGAVVGLAVVLAASGLVPLFSDLHWRPRPTRVTLAGLAVLIVVATGVALIVPAYSPSAPQAINVLHIEDRSEDQAYLALEGAVESPDGRPDVPAPLLAAAQIAGRGFDEVLIPFLPWSDDRFLIAPAPGTDATAPSVEILADERADGMRMVTLRLHSERGGERISLYVPERGELLRIAVEGVERPLEDFPVEKGYQAFHCFGAACDGLELTLSLAGDAALSLLVVDSTSDLPPEGEALLAARPAFAQPRHAGDRSLVFDWIELDAA